MKYFSQTCYPKYIFCAVLFALTFSSVHAASDKSSVQFVYGNNKPVVDGLKNAWGFTAFIEFDGKKILFNTAGVEEILKHNFEVLGIQAEELDAIVISHHHYEMIQGLGFIMKKNPDIPIYTTETVIETITKTHPEWTKNFKNVVQHEEYTPNIIIQNLKSGQRRGGPKGIYEVHLVLKTEKGLVLFTGCGHPQLRTIAHKSKSLTKVDSIHLLAGGTQLLRPDNHIFIEDSQENLFLPQMHYYSDEYYQTLIKDLKEAGVEYVMPTHCTLEPAESFFKESFGDKFIQHSLGMKLDLPAAAKTTDAQ
jgi:7,8-dihydropterin-6-yl-methyl-4-(beta-D-ribofuranosyl)aminobenzene 5'-phosphate synthase